eukprot:TRINITY_DN2505_c0_g1_i2.p1 TRINITY_DN2505_c0_g1~~TRINITY_DN2505_c0_g1_i2.p1  ORF type:complete len:233 (+),score=47.83 TRINITY_DN2505_c0_g1_i2:108-806(+)
MATRNLLLLGGSGNLGREVVRAFAKRWRVASVDVRANNEAAKSITLSTSRPVSEQANEIRNQLTSFSPRFDAVISVAGGFTMENIKDQSLFANYERMSQVNVVSSLLAAHLASELLVSNGLLVLTGAAGVFKEGHPAMIAYSLAKASVHTLARTLAKSSELPSGTSVVTILPEVMDTPENRAAMPNEDFNKWVKTDKVAALLRQWAEGENRPSSGSFLQLKTVDLKLVAELK